MSATSGSVNTSATTTVLEAVKFAAPIPLPVGTWEMFDVVVIDPSEVQLRPRTELAKALMSMWLHMEPSTCLTLTTKQRNGNHDRLWNWDGDYLSIRFASRPHLTRPDYNGSPLGHERALSHEEFDVALKAVEAHRAAKHQAASRPAKRGSKKSVGRQRRGRRKSDGERGAR